MSIKKEEKKLFCYLKINGEIFKAILEIWENFANQSLGQFTKEWYYELKCCTNNLYSLPLSTGIKIKYKQICFGPILNFLLGWPNDAIGNRANPDSTSIATSWVGSWIHQLMVYRINIS